MNYHLIIDAVLAGDAAKAEQLAIKHMQTFRRLRLEMPVEES